MRVVLVMAAAIALSPSVNAQTPFSGRAKPPGSRPTVSPYLNLLNRANSPAVNYYGSVRPQFEFRADFGQLNRQLTLTRDELRDGAAAPLVTGHSAYFFNYAPYFPGEASASRPVQRSSSPTQVVPARGSGRR